MKVLSLFNGISCGRIALERAGIPVERYVSYEIDEYANQIAKKNYPNDEYYGDVTTADFTQYKGFDLLIGGSPCTYWSSAKIQNREITPDGVGGKLFMEYVRALKESSCKYFLYENNNSIHNNIKAFISKQLGVEPIVINSALMSGQERKRCYWTNISNVAQPKDKGILLKDIIDCKKPFILLNTNNGKSQTVKASSSKVSIANVVRSGSFGATGVVIPIKSETINSSDKAYTIINKTVTFTSNVGVGKGQPRTYNIDLPDGDYIIRKLSPLECERLQTLPDNYTEGISNTQRYKCIGNGWTVDVISHILSFLKEVDNKT